MNPWLIGTLGAAVFGTIWVIMRKRIVYIESPNKSKHYGPWKGIVIHYTAGGSYKGTVSWFRNPEAKVSTHYVIGRAGEIVQMVPLDHNAWHTGQTHTADTSNRCLMGIELANHGRLIEKGGRLYYNTGGRDSDEMRRFDGNAELGRLTYRTGGIVTAWWEVYPIQQIAALVWLLGELNVQHRIPLNLWGHEDICRPWERKKDPGPLFPWHLMPGRRVLPQTKGERL